MLISGPAYVEFTLLMLRAICYVPFYNREKITNNKRKNVLTLHLGQVQIIKGALKRMAAFIYIR